MEKKYKLGKEVFLFKPTMQTKGPPHGVRLRRIDVQRAALNENELKAQNQVVDTDSQEAAKNRKELRLKMHRQKLFLARNRCGSGPIWQSPSFLAEFCDPFLDGTGLNKGRPTDSFNFLKVVLQEMLEKEVDVGPIRNRSEAQKVVHNFLAANTDTYDGWKWNGQWRTKEGNEGKTSHASFVKDLQADDATGYAALNDVFTCWSSKTQSSVFALAQKNATRQSVRAVVDAIYELQPGDWLVLPTSNNALVLLHNVRGASEKNASFEVTLIFSDDIREDSGQRLTASLVKCQATTEPCCKLKYDPFFGGRSTPLPLFLQSAGSVWKNNGTSGVCGLVTCW